MKFTEFMRESQRTCPDLGSDLNNQMHMVIGISTEAGELLDAYKKHFAYGKPLDIVNVAEEIGDQLWYQANLCVMLDLNPEEIMYRCIQKLKQRYPEKFDSTLAIHRDLEAEREILES